MKKIIKFIIKWLGTTKLLSIPREYVGRSLAYYYSSRGKLIYNYADLQNIGGTGAIDLIKQIKSETEMLLADQEAYLVYITVKKTEKLKEMSLRSVCIKVVRQNLYAKLRKNQYIYLIHSRDCQNYIRKITQSNFKKEIILLRLKVLKIT